MNNQQNLKSQTTYDLKKTGHMCTDGATAFFNLSSDVTPASSIEQNSSDGITPVAKSTGLFGPGEEEVE
jgi:hypothetical protein